MHIYTHIRTHIPRYKLIPSRRSWYRQMIDGSIIVNDAPPNQCCSKNYRTARKHCQPSIIFTKRKKYVEFFDISLH